MADDDEIDILGDFSLDNLLSKNDGGIYDNSELVSSHPDVLNCDCSSQWLSDHVGTSSNSTCWYNNGQSEFCTNLVQEQMQNDDERPSVNGSGSENQVSTEDAISDDSGWTKKEEDLLERGIEIFGKSHVRLAQFIGTKSANEVKYYLKNFYFNTQSCFTEGAVSDVIEETVIISDSIEHISDSDLVLDDSEIPASIEEVIAAVSTAKPTVATNSKKSRKNSNSKLSDGELIDFKDIPGGHSILKSNVYRNLDHNRKSDGKIVESDNIERSPNKNNKGKNLKDVKFKFRTKIKVPKKEKSKSNKKVQRPEIKFGENVDTKKVIPNINGEEVITMKKENTGESESDLEIDIEDIADECNSNSGNLNKSYGSDTNFKVESSSENGRNISSIIKEEKEQKQIDELEDKDLQMKISVNLSNMNEKVTKQLMSMETPTCELMLAQDAVTDLEKCMNGEFFEGRPTKTPGRYLKIRNHILNMWASIKPLYITKTSLRPGLKNCGDVNSIGRIHQFLEQIGAINFGCAQTTYIRPLYEILVTNVSPPKEKVKEFTVAPSRPITLSRVRIKKKFVNDGEGGCTLTHNEKGDVINTTVVNEEPLIKQQRACIKKPSIRLIYCKPFTEDHPQEYEIHLHLSALLLMDLHAHMSHSEVMGLIGGYWNPGSKTLTITRYVPCKNIAPSATHCDMCPISQAKAADMMHGEGLNILGWFHSHPTFAPEPSQQDLDTQLLVQQWIGNNKPCIGLILSPFSAHGALIASPYRCLIVDKKHNFEDQYVPYKFKVELVSSNLDVSYLLNQAWRIFNTDYISTAERVDFNKTYFLDQSISYLDKFMSSLKMHLAKCSNINKMTCDAITEGFSNICCHI